MRILLVSDLHYTLRQFDWCVSQAAGYDLLVVAGDSLDVASTVPLNAQVAVVSEFLAELARHCPVAVCSGNHDLAGPDEHGEQAALWLRQPIEGVALDGQSLLIEDHLVTICPWWDGPVGRQAVEDQLQGDHDRRPAHWIWVYHWPPAGSPTCWTGKAEYGDQDLRTWIGRYRPDLVLTGHVHQSPFEDRGAWIDRMDGTSVLNAGRQRGPQPTHVAIDLAGGTATWSSQMGVETAVLAGQ